MSKASKGGANADMAARMLRLAEDGPAPSNQPPEPGIPVEDTAKFQPEKAPFDAGSIDGRTLRKTHREPFATRIKPETHKTLKRIAFEREVTIAEVLELAVAAYAKS